MSTNICVKQNRKMKVSRKNTIAPTITFLVCLLILGSIQHFVPTKMLLAERFINGGGWIQVFLMATYGAFLQYKMQNRTTRPLWRRRSWLLFTLVFFGQLMLGLIGFDQFLLTGKLHLPIPAMIIAGPIYRGELSVMTLLFISTLLLSGPSWCSHLCYFGALDNMFANKQKRLKATQTKWAIKHTILAATIATTIAMRWLGATPDIAMVAGLIFGVTGLSIIIFVSPRKGKMVHCTTYCPIGTVVNYTSRINPFRLRIDSHCTQCMKCVAVCRYNALSPYDISNHKPNLSCTLCGDCLSNCHTNSFQYKLGNISPKKAENIYLILTVSLHTIFMALGRI